MAELEIGQDAPPFELPTDGSATIKLADLRGKFVVLFFYPKDDTAACTAEAIDFSRLKSHFARAGAAVIGISPDSPKRHAKFTAKHGLTVNLAADEKREVIDAYGVWAEKTMFGVTYMGVVRTTFLISPQGKIITIWRKVKVGGHAAEVLAAVKAA